MAGRFLFKKLSSGASRSRSLLGGYASDSAAFVRRAPEGDTGTINHGAWIRGYAAGCFNTLPCSNPAAKTSIPTTSMPSVINRCMKASCLDPFRVKGTFAFSTSRKVIIDWEAERAACRAQWTDDGWAKVDKAFFDAEFAAGEAKFNAKKAAYDAELAAWKAKTDADDATFDYIMRSIFCAWIAIGVCCLVKLKSRSNRGGEGQSPQLDICGEGQSCPQLAARANAASSES